MSDKAGTIEALATEIALVFEPLARMAADGSVDQLPQLLGLRPSETSAGSARLSTALSLGAGAAASLPQLVVDLVAAIEADDGAAIGTAGLAVLDQVRTLIHAVQDAAAALQDLSADPVLTPQQHSDVAAFAAVFVERLLSRLFVEYLEVRFPIPTIVLTVTGAVEVVPEAGGPAGSLQAPYLRKTVHFERLARLFTDPTGLLRDVYRWGDPGFDGVALFTTLQTLLSRWLELPAEILQPAGDPAMLEAFGFTAEVDRTLSPPGLTFSVRVPAGLSRTDTIEADDWTVSFKTNATFAADLEGILRPPVDIEVNAASGAVDVALKVEFGRSATAVPFLLLGTAAGSRLEVQRPSAAVGLELRFDGATRRVAIDPEIALGLRGGKLVISGAGGDGFLTTLLSDVTLESNFDVGLTWSPSRGIQFTGSAALEIAIPSHVSLGPLEIQTLYLRAGLASDGSIPIELSGAFQATLGPLAASVDRLGVDATLRFPARGGNLGPADVSFAFKPPNGVGLSVNAGVVTGGGYLYIDTDRGEYAGALQLMVADTLALSAIGLISTKMPDGSSGFSLLIIITAEFASGIQLGFGFTLNAVGGLLGVNRTMLFQPLLDGVRTGAVDSIMFPRDVIANAPRIISDLRAIFPPQQGIFLIGPMAKLGWGEPTLVSLSLGVIIEIPPGDVAILGVLKLALPAEDEVILLLQVNFAGALEFDKQRFYFFASLFDSRILFITIEGEMGVLFAYGHDANFVVSVGGFHPQFHPPPLPFPLPKRIQVNIINESFARIRCEGYFAVTTNSVHFGTKAEFFFGFDALNVRGHAGFDAQFQFSPFHFTVSISAGFSVQVFGIGMFGIDVDLTLEGPTPWHAHGTASISFFFFSIGIGIDFTWGDSRDTTLPPILVMPILAGELTKQSNWRAVLPSGSNLLVSLRKLDPAESQFVLHPVGTLQISQRAVPLDLVLDKVGSTKPGDANHFTLSVTSADLVKTRDLQESFPPSQFKNYADATKLSQPAYVPLDSGIELSAAGDAYASGTAITRIVRYDLTVIDTKRRRLVTRFFKYAGALFAHFLGGASVTRSPLSAFIEQQTHPFEGAVRVAAETFAVARQSDNTVFHPEAASFTSQAAAGDYLARAVGADPTLAGTLHVLPHFEVAA